MSNSIDREAISPCSFCGGSIITIEYGIAEYWVVCNNCKSHLGMFNWENEAIEAWNKRAKG